MNRTDRLLALLLELQSKGKRRAEDLATTFEISKRTVYRDIQALCEAGVPVVALPGQGYSLMQGYFLPPLSFTTDEATVLLLGSDFVARHFDSQYKSAAESASRKIEAVLTEKSRQEVRYLQNSIALVPMSLQAGENDILRKLRRAVIEQRTAQMLYNTRFSKDGTGKQTLRDVDPYGLVNFSGSWYVIGYCHLRKEIRNFRMDRIAELTISEKTFIRPADFKMESNEQGNQRKTIIRALFDKEVADWVREWRTYYIDSVQETAEGLLVTLRVRVVDEVINWLLSWGSHVKILEPASLQNRVLTEAQKILETYKKMLT